MDLDAAKYSDLRVKHLEMIQNVVARMAAQAASLKNYCVTLTTALCGFVATLHRPSVAALAVLPIIAFAFLDARFLWLERRFRGRFDQVRCESWTTPPSFALDVKSAPGNSYLAGFASWSVGCFYGPLALGVIMIAEIINGTL